MSGGYSRGRVRLLNNQSAVAALWELFVRPSAYEWPEWTTVKFNTTDVHAIVREHNRVAGRLLVEPILGGLPGGGATGDGAPVNVGEEIEGPSNTLLLSGTASATTTTTITHTGAFGANDSYQFQWVGVRIGTTAEEWRQISTNTANVLTVAPAFSGLFGAQAYQIRSPILTTLAGYMAGTPQDWTAAGILAGHRIYFAGQDRVADILTVAPLQLTLTANWAGLTKRKSAYAISMNQTGNRGYNRDWNEVANRGAKLTALVDQLDVDVQSMLGARVNYDLTTFLTSGWAADGLLFFSVAAGRVFVYLDRVRKNPAANFVLNDLALTLPAGARPGTALNFVYASNASGSSSSKLSVATNGQITVLSALAGTPSITASFSFLQEN